jgi:hypothetical protein
MIDQFVEDLIKEKGLPADLDSEVRQQLVNNLTERVANLINRRLIDALPDEKVTELEKLVDTNPQDAQAFQKFMADNVPNQEQVIAAALLEFRGLYLQGK